MGIDIEKRYKHMSCNHEALIHPDALQSCSMHGPLDAAETIVVWGDSHADAWMTVFLDIGERFNKRVIFFRHIGCPPLLGVVRTDGQGHSQNCLTPERAKAIITTVHNLKPKHVFLISRWSLYANGWSVGGVLQPANHFLTTDPNQSADIHTSRKAISDELPATVYALAQVSPVTIFRTIPILKANVEAIFLERNTPTTLNEHRAWESFTDQVIETTIRNAPPSLKPITALDPAELFCSREKCAIAINNTVMYKDDNHITPQGTLLFENEILRIVQ